MNFSIKYENSLSSYELSLIKFYPQSGSIYLINSDKLLANVTITINVGSMNYLLVGNLTLN